MTIGPGTSRLCRNLCASLAITVGLTLILTLVDRHIPQLLGPKTNEILGAILAVPLILAGLVVWVKE